MATMQAVLDLARKPLNDSDKVRYKDADLLVSANAALATLRRQRPDLWFGKLGAPFAALLAGDTFPLDVHYQQPVADYAASRALLVDDSEATAALMAGLGGSFAQGLAK